MAKIQENRKHNLAVWQQDQARAASTTCSHVDVKWTRTLKWFVVTYSLRWHVWVVSFNLTQGAKTVINSQNTLLLKESCKSTWTAVTGSLRPSPVPTHTPICAYFIICTIMHWYQRSSWKSSINLLLLRRNDARYLQWRCYNFFLP